MVKHEHISRRRFLEHTTMLGVAAAVGEAAAQTPARTDFDFDFIIVGAGSSGCVIANRLSADSSVRVLLIEAGGAGNAAAIDTPGTWTALLGSSADWNYETAPMQGLGGRSIRWPRGKVLGGSSAISAMAHVRGHRRDFDEWARAAGDDWSFNALLPLFKRLEDNSRGASEYHGAGANPSQRVADTTDPHAGHDAFLEAARQRGFNASPTWDFDGATQENGAGFYQKNIKDGRRHSAATAFLVPALSRPNLIVWDNTRVHRLEIQRGRVTGVTAERGGTVSTIRAARGVVIAAGVIETPKLLMLSGIGPAAMLGQHGVTAIVDAPGVGANLHDHPRVPVRWHAKQPLAPSSVSAGLCTWADAGRAGSASPDIQFYVGRGLDAADPFVTLTVALSRPTSRGNITLRSADPAAAPIIQPGYFSDPSDLERLAAGVRLAREIAGAPAYEKIRGEAAESSGAVGTDAETSAYIRRVADTMFHAVGTCRMGRDAASVVDPQLRVRGVERLWVADASIMPVCVNSQTHAVSAVIGERASEYIRRTR